MSKWLLNELGRGGDRGREPGRTGGGRGREAGEQGVRSGRTGGGKRENMGREAGSIWGREAGAEVKKVIQSLLFITGYYSVKNTYLLKFPFNIHQCLKENFGSKKT